MNPPLLRKDRIGARSDDLGVRDTIGFLMNDTARLFRRAFDARTRQLGITALQWRVLAYLLRNDGSRQGPLADLLEIEPITLSRMIDRLEDSGLVLRRADPTDRRAWLLHVTPRAEDLLRDTRSIVDEVTAEATEGLSLEERSRLAKLIEHVYANLARADCGKDERGRK